MISIYGEMCRLWSFILLCVVYLCFYALFMMSPGCFKVLFFLKKKICFSTKRFMKRFLLLRIWNINLMFNHTFLHGCMDISFLFFCFCQRKSLFHLTIPGYYPSLREIKSETWRQEYSVNSDQGRVITKKVEQKTWRKDAWGNVHKPILS